ncbi:MAG: DUF1772 domain-containing protein [Bryobacteraceae bacterium]
MRLGKETYIAVQAIYYPGFTYGGIAEILGIVATLVLLILTPTDDAAFWWTLTALTALVVMHGAYWVITHPVNKWWLKDQDLKGLGAKFFSSDPLKRGGVTDTGGENWKSFRDRWEYSHVLRAMLSVIALIALTVAIAI